MYYSKQEYKYISVSKRGGGEREKGMEDTRMENAFKQFCIQIVVR